MSQREPDNQDVDNQDTHPVASGVDALIERLREQGVSAGEAEARQRLEDAQRQADALIARAESQAQTIRQQAQQEAEQLRRGGEEALQIAMRDILLKLKSQLSETVSSRVQHLIAHQLDQEAFIQQLLLQVAGKARRDHDLDRQSSLQVTLPEKLIGLEELRERPLELQEGGLSHFILSVAADVLRDGVEFASGGAGSGIVLRLHEQDVEIDLTDERLSEVLLEHLQPRFRAILEGMVK